VRLGGHSCYEPLEGERVKVVAVRRKRGLPFKVGDVLTVECCEWSFGNWLAIRFCEHADYGFPDVRVKAAVRQ